VTDVDDRAAYFVDRVQRLDLLERLLPLASAVRGGLRPEEVELNTERIAELRHEVRELGGRLGFSVRRKVNARLQELGLPEISK